MTLEIASNLKRIREGIEKAALKAGRNPEEVHLVAVSKTVDITRIKEAIAAGITILGENYFQEARPKIAEIGPQVKWHFIGHLQSNKAKYAVRLFDLIHSVDSVDLAKELNQRAKQLGRIIKILLQVNISGEKTKFGLEKDKVIPLIEEISKLKNLSLEGLMTMPPYFEEPEHSRPYYQALRRLREEIGKLKIEDINLKELSMGMSNDFEIAIEEGATLVRIGSAIFGPRPS